MGMAVPFGASTSTSFPEFGPEWMLARLVGTRTRASTFASAAAGTAWPCPPLWAWPCALSRPRARPGRKSAIATAEETIVTWKVFIDHSQHSGLPPRQGFPAFFFERLHLTGTGRRSSIARQQEASQCARVGSSLFL